MSINKLFTASALTLLSFCAQASGISKEVSVFGLNCGPCGEALRAQMQSTAGALDLEAKLECGKIFVDMAEGMQLNEGGLNLILLSKGYTLKGVKDSQISVAQAREMGDVLCKSS